MTTVPSKNEYVYTPDIQGYQNAVWDFLMEHCDVLDSGALFMKFHTDSRVKFENRVYGRWKHNYHRDGYQERKTLHQELRKATDEEKTLAKARWQANKLKGREKAPPVSKWKRIITIIFEK